MNKFLTALFSLSLGLSVIGVSLSLININIGSALCVISFYLIAFSCMFEIFKIRDKQKKTEDVANAENVKDKVYFAKLRDSATIPSKDSENGGYDIYADISKDIVIPPNKTVMIETGICSAFSETYVYILKERGSTGTKGMGQRAGVIDSGFRGEWKVPITNHNDKPLIISCGKNDDILNKEQNIIYPYRKAICQAILVNVPDVEIVESTADYVKNIPSKRGDGMLGSSGK